MFLLGDDGGGSMSFCQVVVFGDSALTVNILQF